MTGPRSPRSRRRAPRPGTPAGAGSEAVDLPDRVDEGTRRLLRQIVADAAGDEVMLVFAGELAGVARRFRMRGAVGVAFERDGRHGDDRCRREPALDLV